MQREVSDYWEISKEQVEGLATKVGIPKGTPLPEVLIVGKKADSSFQRNPQIHKSSDNLSPSGYFIAIPERYLESVDKSGYTLGKETEIDIGHELSHYLDYLELGLTPGADKDPYMQAVKEVRADLRGGVVDMSISLSKIASVLRDDYGLVSSEAFSLIARAAGSLGISKQVINRAKRLFNESNK